MAARVGGPKRHWLKGHLDKYPFSEEGLKNMIDRCDEFPKMAAQWLGPTHMIVHLYHPDVVQPALKKSFPKSWGYKFLARFVRQGLITSKGALWKRHRKLLTSVFHFDIIKNHISVFNQTVHKMVSSIDSVADTGNKFDVSELVNAITYENIMRSVFSQNNINSGENGISFISLLKEVNHIAINRLNHPLLYPDFIFALSPTGRKFDNVQKTVYKMLKKIIAERRTLLKELSNQGDDVAELLSKSKKGYIDFLNLLLLSEDSEGKLSEDEIMDEVVTFFGAGQETVASSLAWTIYNLAKNIEWQEKCREEIFEIVGNNEVVESAEESRMKTVTMCIKEAMRLYPIIHVIGRELTEDVKFNNINENNDSVILEKGTIVNINLYALHRNRTIWKHDPEIYHPERFTPEESSKRSPYQYLPFAAGPRNCIGQNFAMHQMRVILSHLLRKFEFYLEDDCVEPEIQPGVTLQMKDGMEIKARRYKLSQYFLFFNF